MKGAPGVSCVGRDPQGSSSPTPGSAQDNPKNPTQCLFWAVQILLLYQQTSSGNCMVNEERKCSESQFNFSISVGSSLFGSVSKDVESLPRAVVAQCLGAGQLPQL